MMFTDEQPAAPSEKCICVMTGLQSQSFEEVRIANYLESYRATGRPPAPCPEYPADPAARAAQHLPPLFVPAPFPPSRTHSAATITDPARLALTQSFAWPVLAPEGEALASIAAAPEYAHWSHDELRHYAYLRGARVPPPGTNLYYFLSNPVAAPALASANAPGDGSGDQFVRTISRLEGVATRAAPIQPPPRTPGMRYYAYLRGARIPPPGRNLFLSNSVAAPTVAASGNAPGDGSGDQLVSTICRLEGVATRVASIQPPPRTSGGGGRMPQIQYHSSLPDDAGFPASLIW
ncbi:hypothetical protein C8R44DRAFT_865635 [Mycena epipterygia]|nr:hypothetical protein C8R44DRAFT_865635 [Mycena epipterygia]